MHAPLTTPARRRRRGQGMTEYIILVGLVAIGLIGAVTTFKGALFDAFWESEETIRSEVELPIRATTADPANDE